MYLMNLKAYQRLKTQTRNRWNGKFIKLVKFIYQNLTLYLTIYEKTLKHFLQKQNQGPYRLLVFLKV